MTFQLMKVSACASFGSSHAKVSGITFMVPLSRIKSFSIKCIFTHKLETTCKEENF